MTTAAVVTIIAVVLVVLVLAAFLLTIARVLAGVDKTLGAVITAVGTIATKTEPVEDVVDSLNRNLDTASGALTSLLESKVGAEGAATLVRSVDPLGAGAAPAPEPSRERIRYERANVYGASASAPEPVLNAQPEPSQPPFTGGGGGKIRFGGRPGS